jgi:hypothetical protein
VDLKAQQVKRDRALNYWQNNVIQNYLPSIDTRKQNEVQDRILQLNSKKLRHAQ